MAVRKRGGAVLDSSSGRAVCRLDGLFSGNTG
jgi:hypothetical protein